MRASLRVALAQGVTYRRGHQGDVHLGSHDSLTCTEGERPLGCQRPVGERLVANAVGVRGGFDEGEAPGRFVARMLDRRQRQILGRRPPDAPDQGQVRVPGPQFALEAERRHARPEPVDDLPARLRHGRRHRDQHLGLGPELEPVEFEFDRRPGPLPAGLDQLRQGSTRDHPEEGERHVQVGRRDRVAVDLENGGRSGDRERRAPGIARPEGKEEPELWSPADAGFVHEAGRPSSAAWAACRRIASRPPRNRNRTA